jgi:4-hydroxybenzoyl-CoA thioesterase
VRFEDCDPAGIVFYPRYILMLHRHFEDWFAEGLGFSLGVLNVDRLTGFPVKSLHVEFLRPSRIEEVLEWKLMVTAIRQAAVTLTITGDCDQERRLKATITVVAVNLTKVPLRPCIIPEDVKTEMMSYVYECSN